MANTSREFETAFDTYTVKGLIGEGGSGRVFEVSDSSGKVLALKCLRPELVTSEKRRRFKNEIDFCASHHHRNLIQVLDFGLATRDGVKTPFYVMHRYPATFRDLLIEKIPAEKVLPIFAQILDGIEAAHLLGVVHRDLKPENVLCDRTQDLLVVADLGIAHFEEEIIATLVQTKLGAKLANLSYSAPEQRTKGAKVDYRADIFALGLMLNEMFTGSVPHGAGYTTVATAAPAFAYLDAIVEKLIQQNPAARPGSIEEIKKELIGRKNDFIALQELDAARRAVVSSAAPGQVAPVTLVDVDWTLGTLLLRLNRVPESRWIVNFQNPRVGISYVMGTDPTRFQFSGDTARVQVESQLAQAVVNQFKNWLPTATQAFQQELIQEAQRNEIEMRKALTRKAAAAEERERTIRNLKF